MANQDLPVIANFGVRRRAYMAPDGSVLRDLPDFAGDQDLVVSLYRAMVLARTFDLKAVSLQRTGRLGTYATSLGQEAVAVGIASAMQQEDVLFPSYRDNAALHLARREHGGHPGLLGRRRARQPLWAGPGFSALHSRWFAGTACGRRRLRIQIPQASPRRGLHASAMARPQRVTCGRR